MNKITKCATLANDFVLFFFFVQLLPEFFAKVARIFAKVARIQPPLANFTAPPAPPSRTPL